MFQKELHNTPSVTINEITPCTTVTKLTEENMRLATVKHWSAMYGSTGQHKEAIQFLRAALNQNLVKKLTDVSDVHYLLGIHLQDSGPIDTALTHYQEVIAINPHSSSDASHRLAVFHHLKGNYEQAIFHYKAALRQDASNHLIQENLAKLYNIVHFNVKDIAPRLTKVINLTERTISNLKNLEDDRTLSKINTLLWESLRSFITV
jgi:tetratricopeptide (TPR) repeat protein